MEKDKSIDVLNTLITINNDRIEGYNTASEGTDEQDLKSLFAKFTTTSQKCREELVREVNRLGGEIAEGTLISGKFFRVWMDLKAALTGRDREAILNSCEYGEDQAQDTYEDALKHDMNHLSVEQRTMVTAQKSLLKADHDHVRSMRDAFVNA
ncbi:MAG: PA2169 family four-helix-bundle protein [Saprospiraceae bacterium]|nr:PA2169 family four-helix-bundle protein [Saprospiraceae bacterium]